MRSAVGSLWEYRKVYVLLKLGFCPGLRLAGRTQAFLYLWESQITTVSRHCSR